MGRRIPSLRVRLAAVAFLCLSSLATVGATPSLRPAITNGLVHYWPDPWNARDEVTGAEGVVMALLAEDSSGDGTPMEFSHRTGWVQLRVPSLPVDFSVACWLRWKGSPVSQPMVLWCEGEGRRWALQQFASEQGAFGVVTDELDEPERAEVFHITQSVWHHLVLTQDRTGRLRVWVDGSETVKGRTRRLPPPSPEWLSVGNTTKGDQQWTGALADLAWYARPLGEAEVQALHRAGRSRSAAEPSAARRRARGRVVEPQWSTNLTREPVTRLDRRNYTSEDNLPGNTIQALWQARDGFLWVGTEYGLARFDGHRFERFGMDNTSAMATVGCDVSCLVEDAGGDLWAGLFGGLLRIQGTEITAVTEGLPERFILRLAPAGSNALWVAGYRTDSNYRGACRLRRYVPGTGASTAFTTVPGQVRRLVDTPGGVWIVTEQPELVLFWDGESAAPQVHFKIVSPEPVLLEAVSDGAAVTVPVRGWRDPAEPRELWVETQGGAVGPAFNWQLRSGEVEAQVSRWSGDSPRRTWVAAGRGLARLQGSALARIEFPERPLPPEVTVMCANREGGVWLGTWEDGLHFLRDRPLQVLTTDHGLADNDVRSVCRSTSRGGAWVGTRGGVNHLRNGRAELIAQGQAQCVAEDATGRLWWGVQDASHASLQYLDADGSHPFLLPGMEWRGPSAMHFARNGTLWVACSAGVTWVKANRLPGSERSLVSGTNASDFGRFRRGIELPASEPLGLVEDHEGAIWVGSRGDGLCRLREGRVERWDTSRGFPGSFALPVLADESGALWAFSSSGIVRRRAERFEWIGPGQGAPRDLVFSLVEDSHGGFWLPGGHGIHRLTRADLEAALEGRLPGTASLTLGLRDGMLTPECSAVAMPGAATLADGSVAVATHNGLVLVNPERAVSQTLALPVIFDRVVVNRRAVRVPRTAVATRSRANAAAEKPKQPVALELPPGSGRQLEIHFTAVSLLAADRVQFRHWLAGQDQDWSEDSAQRVAFYSNLRPGHYQFHVQAANAQGVWPEEERVLGLMIHPFFWETRIFQVAAALTVAVVLLLLHRQRVRVLRDLQELRHKQQFDGERARIAADMHDDLGAALTQIAILGEVAKRQVSNSPQAISLLDRITQSARDVTSRMSDLVWATNPRHDSLDNLSAHLREQAARMLQDTPVRPLLCFPVSLPAAHLSATVRRNVLLVMKEAINNALRHGRPSEIRVSFVAEAQQFKLVVEDNGCGFDAVERKESGNGLTNMRRRIADLGGDYELVSTPEAGTRISLSVPLPRSEDGGRPTS